MLKDLEQLKKQLIELAVVINSFKSEAVQLKIIDFIFKGGGLETTALPDTIGVDASEQRNRRRKKRSSPREPRGASAEEKRKTSRGRSGSGKGASATLTQLIEGDFFDQKRTIGDVVDHCALCEVMRVNQVNRPLLAAPVW
jgi:hypothetical protein